MKQVSLYDKLIIPSSCLIWPTIIMKLWKYYHSHSKAIGQLINQGYYNKLYTHFCHHTTVYTM
jgi:hypothetical protein